MRAQKKKRSKMSSCIFCKSENTKSKKFDNGVQKIECLDCLGYYTTDKKGIATKSECFAKNSYSWWVREDIEQEIISMAASNSEVKTMFASQLILGSSKERTIEIMRDEKRFVSQQFDYSSCESVCEQLGIPCNCKKMLRE